MFLCFDEAIAIHENLNYIGLYLFKRGLLQIDWLIHWAWVIPYGIAVVILMIILSKFLIQLSPKFRRLFIFAGAVYVAGSLGFEILAAKFGDTGFWGFLIMTLEESLEIAGILIFIYALLSYITVEFRDLSIRMTPMRIDKN